MKVRINPKGLLGPEEALRAVCNNTIIITPPTTLEIPINDLEVLFFKRYKWLGINQPSVGGYAGWRAFNLENTFVKLSQVTVGGAQKLRAESVADMGSGVHHYDIDGSDEMRLLVKGSSIIIIGTGDIRSAGSADIWEYDLSQAGNTGMYLHKNAGQLQVKMDNNFTVTARCIGNL